MKKIDILNFITDFRKAPNSIKTQQQIVSHLGIQHEPTIQSMLEDLQKANVVKQTDLNGEKAYQVIAKWKILPKIESCPAVSQILQFCLKTYIHRHQWEICSKSMPFKFILCSCWNIPVGRNN